MRAAPRLAFALLVVLGGCDAGELDGGLQDAGDTGTHDAGTHDAASPGVDASPDAGPVDASAPPPPPAPDAGADAASTPDDAGPPTEPPPPDPTSVEATFRVLHWNIAGGKENDCRTPGITAAVVRFVRERDVDFVGLNEVCPAQYDSIREALREHWGKGRAATFSAFVPDRVGRVVGNAIFSRFNIEDVTREKVGEDRYGNRNLLCARVRAYPHLRFCSTHLTPGDATARVQLGRVLTRIEGWWENRRDTVILTGDLNLHPNDPGLNAVYAPEANHPRNNPNNHGRYREVDDADPDHCPGYGERSLPGTSGGPCRQGGKIDFIFVRRNRIVDGRYAGDTLNIPTTCSGVCSDHRAVFGRIRVRIRS